MVASGGLSGERPLVGITGARRAGGGRGGEAAARFFAEAGVHLIATGHVHAPFALPISLGDHGSYGVGCGTLSRRERGSPPSFNQIDWDAHQITVTAMAWTGDRFEPSESWKLARRQDTRRTATAPDPNAAGQMEKAAV